MPLHLKVRSLPKENKVETPVWKGPEDSGPKGGITQSMLNNFLACRERFRLQVIEGLVLPDTFNHRMEYGSMWHTCEEWYVKGESEWIGHLKKYASGLCARYKTQQQQIQHWYLVCKTQFPIYQQYWKKHPLAKKRTTVAKEQVFNVPFTLPSGRVVHLRGRWDGLDKVQSVGLSLQENKTKGDINEQQLRRQLTFDLQTMFYVTAYEQSLLGETHGPLKEILYNVVRRPLSGGTGSIKQKQGESDDEFYARLGAIISDSPEYFFMRWPVQLQSTDVGNFTKQFLNPILEELCNWYHWITSKAAKQNPFEDHIHYRLPYGIYNVIAEGGSTDLDEYLYNGSEVGLVREDHLFRELQ